MIFFVADFGVVMTLHVRIFLFDPVVEFFGEKIIFVGVVLDSGIYQRFVFAERLNFSESILILLENKIELIHGVCTLLGNRVIDYFEHLWVYQLFDMVVSEWL